MASADLARAEERRAAMGGNLETSLLELGILGELEVRALLAELSGLPGPPLEALGSVGPAFAPLFPRQLAERYGMVPLGLIRRQLSLLVRHPVDLATVDEIGFLLSRPLKLFVGSELEIGELQKLIYGLPLSPRLQELRAQLNEGRGRIGGGEAASSSARPHNGENLGMSEAERVTPRARRLVDLHRPGQGDRNHEPERVALPAPAAPAAGKVPVSPVPTGLEGSAWELRLPGAPKTSAHVPAAAEAPGDAAPAIADEPSAFTVPPPALPPARSAAAARRSTGEALTALRAQTTRDGIVGIAVEFLRAAFDFVAVLARRKEHFYVFEASGADFTSAIDPAKSAVELERSKVLRTVVESRAPYVGPIPPADPLETALGSLGRARLRAVFLYPIVVRDRTVAVIHGDRGGEALAPRQLADVALVLSQVGGQLERVIRERRREPTKVPKAPAPKPRPPPLPAPKLAPAAPAPEITGVYQRPATAVSTTPDVPPALPVVAPVVRLVSAPAQPAFSLEPDITGVLLRPARPAEPPVARDAPAASLTFEDPAEPTVVSVAPSPSSVTSPAASRTAREEEPFEVPVDWVDAEEDRGMTAQVRAFLSGDPPARARAAEVLKKGGLAAAAALAERFPGPLYAFRVSIDELPPPSALGPLIALMASLGEDAVPALTELSYGPTEERRFWATVLLAKLGLPAAMPALANRLFDTSPDVALAARRGLQRLRQAPNFAAVLDQVMEQLTTSDPERLSLVIRALGQFHHVPAIPRLISLVGIRDAHISETAAEALRELTRQNFQQNERRWIGWWEEAKSRPRTLWLIDALESRDRDLRLAAISELTDLVGLDFGFRSDIEPRKQGAALAEWRAWWAREGESRA